MCAILLHVLIQLSYGCLQIYQDVRAAPSDRAQICGASSKKSLISLSHGRQTRGCPEFGPPHLCRQAKIPFLYSYACCMASIPQGALPKYLLVENPWPYDFCGLRRG